MVASKVKTGGVARQKFFREKKTQGKGKKQGKLNRKTIIFQDITRVPGKYVTSYQQQKKLGILEGKNKPRIEKKTQIKRGPGAKKKIN